MSSPPLTPCDHENVYQLAEDTYLLQRAALAGAGPGTLALEIGCGSGFISQGQAPRAGRLIATDISPMPSGQPSQGNGDRKS